MGDSMRLPLTKIDPNTLATTMATVVAIEVLDPNEEVNVEPYEGTTEDEDDAIQTRVRLVNPQTGVTGLDRTFNERNIQIGRVALQGPLADEMPHCTLDGQQDVVTAPSRLEVWLSLIHI